MKIFLMKMNVRTCILESSSHINSSYNVKYLFLFRKKMTNKYNKTFNKKISTLNSENVAQNFVRLARHFLPEMSTLRNYEKNGPLLPKKQTNDLVVSFVFLIDL